MYFNNEEKISKFERYMGKFRVCLNFILSYQLTYIFTFNNFLKR